MTHRSALTRVEGQGAVLVDVADGAVVETRLDILEPPRFFEALLVGRRFDAVCDLTARICGICPVAYQMTAAHALEELFGVEVPEGTRELRRILYCGEWIQSHMLHVHLMAAPDLLGYPDATAMAGDDQVALRRGLRVRSVGTALMATIGGRAVHPVSPRVGGFSGVPAPARLEALLPGLDRAAEDVLEVADWVAGFESPSLPRPADLVALTHPDEYPMNEGVVARSSGDSYPTAALEERLREEDVGHSSARHAYHGGGLDAVVGPLARYGLNRGRLGPLAREAARRLSLTAPATDPFRATAVRVVETAFAVEEARRLIRSYRPPHPAWVPARPRAGRAQWATEAPRGLLYHRYDLDADGVVRGARIVPPTSQNLPVIDADLRRAVTAALGGDGDEVALTRAAETLVRAYDPCISCATHMVRLRVRPAISKRSRT